MHQTGSPVTALAKERGSARHSPAGPGPRRVHPLVMLSLARLERIDARVPNYVQVLLRHAAWTWHPDS